MSKRVMVIDPTDQHFMEEGILLVDDADWSAVDLGYPEGIPVEGWSETRSPRSSGISASKGGGDDTTTR